MHSEVAAMSDAATPWYVRWVVGVGAWITAIIMMILGGAIVYVGFEFDDEMAIVVIGAIYLAAGIWLIRQHDRGVFMHQLAIATVAAGAGLVAGGIAAKADELWVGFVVSLPLLALVTWQTSSRILQFLIAVMALWFFSASLMEGRTPYLVDIASLATPLGLYLLLRPPQRNLVPTAIALILFFPVFSILVFDNNWWYRGTNMGGTFAQILHIVLFLGLVYLHWKKLAGNEVRAQIVVFAILATAICVMLPPGGSAAMLVLMLAFLIGSRPIALAGMALQGQFIIRYYYELGMTLLDKSLLLMAVGALLLAAWWLTQRSEAAK